MSHQHDTSHDEAQTEYLIARDYERFMRQVAKECSLKISKQRTASRDPNDWRYIVRRQRSGEIVFGEGYACGLGQTYVFVRSWDKDRRVRLRRRRLQAEARRTEVVTENS
jgi:hypothetical protein